VPKISTQEIGLRFVGIVFVRSVGLHLHQRESPNFAQNCRKQITTIEFDPLYTQQEFT
jgi:hypothetical protein